MITAGIKQEKWCQFSRYRVCLNIAWLNYLAPSKFLAFIPAESICRSHEKPERVHISQGNIIPDSPWNKDKHRSLVDEAPFDPGVRSLYRAEQTLFCDIIMIIARKSGQVEDRK